jgi:hypothetical protein
MLSRMKIQLKLKNQFEEHQKQEPENKFNV